MVTKNNFLFAILLIFIYGCGCCGASSPYGKTKMDPPTESFVKIFHHIKTNAFANSSIFFYNIFWDFKDIDFRFIGINYKTKVEYFRGSTNRSKSA